MDDDDDDGLAMTEEYLNGIEPTGLCMLGIQREAFGRAARKHKNQITKGMGATIE